MSAWRRYDVRGATAEVLSIGVRTAALYRPSLIERSVAVGHDGSRDAMQVVQAIVRELKQEPSTFVATGPATAGMLHYLSRFHALAIMVTASHAAQAGVTGLKIATDARPWETEDYGALARALEDPARQPPTIFGYARPQRTRWSGEVATYQRALIDAAGGPRVLDGLAVHVHGGSAVAVRSCVQVLEALGAEVAGTVNLATDPAAHVFGADTAGPTGAVKIFLDADADRLGYAGPDDQVWSPEMLSIYLSELNAQILDRTGLLVDLRHTDDAVNQLADLGTVTYGAAGRAMTNRLRVPGGGYALGMEISGHYYWPQWGGLDDAIFGAVQLCLQPPPPGLVTVATVERVERRSAQPWPGVETALRDLGPDEWTHRVDTRDGVRWWSDEGWVTIRATSDNVLAIEGVGTRVMSA